MQQPIDSQSLTARAEELVSLAKKAGATEADAVIVRSRSRSVAVRLGKVESVDASEGDDFSLEADRLVLETELNRLTEEAEHAVTQTHA